MERVEQSSSLAIGAMHERGSARWKTRCDDREGRADAEVVRAFHIRCILAREDGSIVDGLTLREHVWVLLV